MRPSQGAHHDQAHHLATAAAIFAAGTFATAAHADGVKCGGVNACKGQSACKGATNSCKGQNACKGQGCPRPAPRWNAARRAAKSSKDATVHKPHEAGAAQSPAASAFFFEAHDTLAGVDCRRCRPRLRNRRFRAGPQARALRGDRRQPRQGELVRGAVGELHGAGRHAAHWLDRIRRDYPMALHGVSLSIGSIDPLDRALSRRAEGAGRARRSRCGCPTISASPACAASTCTTCCRCPTPRRRWITSPSA